MLCLILTLVIESLISTYWSLCAKKTYWSLDMSYVERVFCCSKNKKKERVF